MKRKHAVAFQGKDALERLPKECEDIVFGFLSIRDLCRSVAPVSKRLKAIAYSGKHWEKIKMLGVHNHRAQKILATHGRNIKDLTFFGMRISRALCTLFTKCTRLRSLDLTGIWKSSAIDRRFVASITKLPLTKLCFGQNQVCDEGFNLLCASMPLLEELDFNSRTVSARALYNVCMLTNLKSLCLRSCAHANRDTLRSICRLKKLRVLQLSFLPMLHCDSLRLLFEEENLRERLETLVLNGMFLNRSAAQGISSMKALRLLSLCHPKVNSNDLAVLDLPKLEIITLFCANELYGFDFLKRMPSLKQLCLYRCACSNSSMLRWVKRRPELHFRLYHPRPIRIDGRLQEPETAIDFASHANLTQLRLMRRPYPMLV